LRIKDQVKIVNLDTGICLFSIKIPGLYFLDSTHDHVIAHCYGEKTRIISGIVNLH